MSPRRVCNLVLRAFILFALVYVTSAPVQRLVTVGEQQQVETNNPVIGVHTRLTDEVEEWKIQQTLVMVREMGASWIVEYFPWAYYEPEKGVYDFGHADMVIEHALAQGLKVIARVDYVPDWARPEDTTARYLDEDHYQDYADFIYAFCEHFEGQLDSIIIWNEPNLAFEWGYRMPDPESYVELLKVAYEAAKAADPDIRVLGAGLAPTLAPEGSEWGMDDLLYLERMYQAGAADYMDGLAVHAYGMTASADDPADPQAINFRRTELVHEIMVTYGDGDKPCIITEGGWNDHPRWTKSVSPYLRIQYTIDAYDLAMNEWDWCEAVCLWVFRFPWPQNTYQDYFAFVSTDFIPKPIYTEIQHYAHDEPYDYLENTP